MQANHNGSTSGMGAPGCAHRNWGIDCLRGLAILLVLLNHLGLGFRLPLSKTWLAEVLSRRVMSAISFNGYEAVFVFFVVSGFLIASRALQQFGSLQELDWRQFYLRRFSRIAPLLLALLVVLAVLHSWGVSGYVIKGPGQSLLGATWATLGLHLNWYEGQSTWLPASWDVLWSLSIEEAFYLAFPVLCLLLPKRLFVIGLCVLAVSVPWTKAALDGQPLWQEKAYLPGFSAIAAGVLCALAAQPASRLPARTHWAMLALGGIGLGSVLFFGDFVYRSLGHGNMLVLIASVAALVIQCHLKCQQLSAPRGLNWLATIGRLSYEIYLSHMFVVLSCVAMFRAAFAPNLAWAFAVYVPCIALCVLLGWALERGFTHPCERWLRGFAANPRP